MNKRESGFTLIELMIVIAIIAIIAAIAIPNLLAAKLSSNETAAIATLRNLTSAQAQIQASGKIDCDNDGIGEYGTFPEMTGTANVRTGSTGSVFTGTPVSPAILSPSLSNVNANGFVTKAGYAFVIYIPGGAAATDSNDFTTVNNTPAFTGGAHVHVDTSETTWCAYAQPVAYGNSGNRRFFVNQSGDVMQSSNDTQKGQGSTSLDGTTTAAAGGDSAFTASSITSTVALGTAGQDGDIWKVTN
ncbi:MAG: prepilin-type N-terminal cleavage/methylation domain-containing protein [Planctomycetota bacterium]|jgi:prepilin-type N-terminal cleavage/methylation domain-containing protein